MRRHFAEIFAISVLMASAALQVQAQNQLRQALSRAEELRLEYRFDESASAAEKALASVDASADSSTVAQLTRTRTWALNGQTMLRYAASPTVVARKQVPLKEFFLWYPAMAGSWCPSPNVLDSSGAFPAATFVPDGSSEIYFSAPLGEGHSQIYRTQLSGGLWSAPVEASDAFGSEGSAIFPVLSSDGKSLYFTSDGLHGCGGYDLYVSRWNSSSREWGEPENLGFPYSSPYNDYLYMDSPDGRYSVLASDRECPGSGDVVIYVLEFDQMPLRRAVSPDEALRLSRLMVPAARAGAGAERSTLSADSRYAGALRQVQALRYRLAESVGTMDRTRSSLSGLEGKARTDLEADLVSREAAILAKRDSLAAATRSLQQIEMDLIAAGREVDPRQVLGGSAASASETARVYEFRRQNFGTVPQMQFDRAKSSFDYTFQVLKVGRFAEDNTLPDGLIYQIQIFSKTSGEASENDLKGLSPVFSRKDKSGKTVYYAGMFRTYNDCNAALTKVKRAGFKSALAVAFRDGESISVTSARQLEKTLVQVYRIRITPDGGRLSEGAMSAINAATSKDLVRENSGGVTTYLIGNFSDIDEASTVLSALKAAGLASAILETVTGE